MTFNERLKILKKQNKDKEAISLLTNEIKKNPNNTHLYYQRCKLYFKNNFYKQANGDIRIAIELSPFKWIYHYKSACLYRTTRQHTLAMKEINKALEIFKKTMTKIGDLQTNKNICKIYHIRGSILYDTENFKKAKMDFKKAFQLDQNNPKVIYGFAQSLRKCSDFLNATKYYNKVYELEKGNYLSTFYRGICFYKLHHFDKAIDSYKQTVEINPQYTFAWLNLINCLTKIGNFKEALHHSERLRELGFAKGSNYPSDEVSRCYFSLGQYKKAITNINNHLKYSPNSFSCNYMKVEILMKQLLFADAAKICKRLKNKYPNNNHFKVLYLRGLCNMYNGKLKEAQNELYFLVQKQPKNPEYINSLHECSRELPNFKSNSKIKVNLNNAKQYIKEKTPIHLKLQISANIYMENNQPQLARKELQKLLIYIPNCQEFWVCYLLSKCFLLENNVWQSLNFCKKAILLAPQCKLFKNHLNFLQNSINN
ncbi:tetratricopeptide repeat protein [Anaeramoeba flamelloides]|uniref:Tetratricopeptide repeat protein n=1 Tax=Anaeramoeba flamelloides TaxID=1746091 RepID=A0ABQ8X3M6_9EUKA|nr:tetratricopeptide repeat protein [Anaeramoeba flamelloides]